MENLKKRSGTSSFKGGERSKQSGRAGKNQQQVPPVGFYEYNMEVIEPKKKNQEIDLSKNLGRHEAINKDQSLVYKSLLDQYDYSSFRQIAGSLDFSKI